MGTHVLANQGGVTVWCAECHEQHNAESWTEERIDVWLKGHRRSCKVTRKRKMDVAIKALEDAGAPTSLVVAAIDFSKTIG